MSRLAMRQAITAFLEEAGIEYVGLVYPARPEVIPEQAYEENRMAEAVASEAGSSAVLVVNLVSDNRQRKADTGRGAVNDQVTYKAVIEIFFACTSGEAVQLGARDYLIKPFLLGELAARIRRQRRIFRGNSALGNADNPRLMLDGDRALRKGELQGIWFGIF